MAVIILVQLLRVITEEVRFATNAAHIESNQHNPRTAELQS